MTSSSSGALAGPGPLARLIEAAVLDPERQPPVVPDRARQIGTVVEQPPVEVLWVVEVLVGRRLRQETSRALGSHRGDLAAPAEDQVAQGFAILGQVRVLDAAVLQVAAELADRDQVGAGAGHRQRAGLHLHPEEVLQPVAQPQRVDVDEVAGMRARLVLAQRDAGVAVSVPNLASPPRPGRRREHGEVDPVQLAPDALPIPTVRDLAPARGAGAQQVLLPPCDGRVHQRRSRRRAALQRPAQVAKEGARVAHMDRSPQIEQPPGGVEHLAGDRLGKVAKVKQRADLLPRANRRSHSGASRTTRCSRRSSNGTASQRRPLSWRMWPRVPSMKSAGTVSLRSKTLLPACRRHCQSARARSSASSLTHP